MSPEARETARAAMGAAVLLVVDGLVIRYCGDRPVMCEGGSVAWGDRASPEAVRTTATAVMTSGNRKDNVRRDGVITMTKTARVASMLTDLSAGMSQPVVIRRVRVMLEVVPTLFSWLDGELSRLTKCRNFYHEENVICPACPRRQADIVPGVVAAVVALHISMARVWSFHDVEVVAAVLRVSTNSQTSSEVIKRLTETLLQWVECGSGFNGRDPPHEPCVWCPDRRRYRCPCTGGLPAEFQVGRLCEWPAGHLRAELLLSQFFLFAELLHANKPVRQTSKLGTWTNSATQAWAINRHHWRFVAGRWAWTGRPAAGSRAVRAPAPLLRVDIFLARQE